MIRALIFDFDGLILETEGPDFQSWHEMFTSYGCTLPFARWATLIGTSAENFSPYAELEAQLGRTVDRAAIRAQRRQRYAELVAAQAVLPGVEDYIATAHRLGLALGVASSSSRAWVVGHLEHLELRQHFTAIACSEDVPRTKPDPALYLTVIAALGVSAEEAIALEDSPNGIAAAKRAGLFCVAIPNALTRELPLDEADLRLTSLADVSLEALLARVHDHPQ